MIGPALTALGAALALFGSTMADKAVAATSARNVPAAVFVAASGADTGPCTSLRPCRSFDRAYRAAKPGQIIEIAAGTYPSQTIRPDRRKRGARVERVVFRAEAGGSVVVDGDLTMHGSNATFAGVKRGEGSYSFRVRRLRSEIDSAHAVSQRVTFRNFKAATFFITGTSFIRIEGGDFGPNVACYARGTTGVGRSGGPITPEGWCPEGSGYERIGNSDAWEPKIGPSGSVPGSWPHDIVLNGVTIHDQNSLDSFNLHNGGLFLVSGYRLLIQNSRFYGNIVYNVFAKDFTNPICCRMTFGAFRDVVIRRNWFAAPVDAAWQPGGNGWTNRRKNRLPELHLVPMNGDPWRNWTITQNYFENGILLGGEGVTPRFINVKVTRNVGGGGNCYRGSQGLVWQGNLDRSSACRGTRTPFGYALEARGLKVLPAQARIVRSIFDDAARGRSMSEISRRLRASGRDSATGRIRQIIESRDYLGNQLGPRGAHPRIVAPSVWRAAQALLD